MKAVDRFVAVFCVSALFFFLLQQAYLGLRSPTLEVDSLTYHLPIAQHILARGWFSVPEIPQGWGYYPAVGESILALFILISKSSIPLFNVLGIGLVFLVSTRLGKRYGLTLYRSLILATGISLLNPAMRLVNNQTVDVWFQLFVLSSLLFLSLPTSGGHFFLSGLSLGLLAGTKYSGPFVAVALLLPFLSTLKPASVSHRLLFALPLSVVGGFWYLRNFLLVGNPFYPATLSFFGLQLTGLPTNRLAEWTPLKTLVLSPNGLGRFLEAVNSEYSVWLVFLGYLLFRLLLERIRGLKNSDSQAFRIGLLGFVLVLMFLFTPSWPQNLVSDLRYTLPGVSLLVFSFFLYFGRMWPQLPLYATLLALGLNFPLLTHHPKINFAFALGFFLVIARLERPQITRHSH